MVANIRRPENIKTIDTQGLMKWLCCGRQAAYKIGNDANARIEISPRKILWNVEKISKYLDAISE